RVYQGLHHVQGLTDLRSTASVDKDEALVPCSSTDSARSVLQSVLAILRYAKHPEFIARELLALFEATAATTSGAVVARVDSGAIETIVEVGERPEVASQVRFPIGQVSGRIIEVILQANSNLDSDLAMRTAVALVETA